jgi:hypothetical protein
MPASGQNAVRRTQSKRPGDLTGMRGQQLAAQARAEKAEGATQIAESLEAQRRAKLAEEVDYSSEARAKAREAAIAGVVEETEIEVRPKTKRIRVLDKIDDMTFGRDVISEGEFDETGLMVKPPVLGGLRSFSFEEGRWYTVDTDVADHLAFLGYIYDER